MRDYLKLLWENKIVGWDLVGQRAVRKDSLEKSGLA